MGIEGAYIEEARVRVFPTDFGSRGIGNGFADRVADVEAWFVEEDRRDIRICSADRPWSFGPCRASVKNPNMIRSAKLCIIIAVGKTQRGRRRLM